ncbi:MAG: hypothetical protein S4CHLAM123_03400 [Chlamydiales bacterium]|nr:hypothetical protein [Chlamydiales bacterium]
MRIINIIVSTKQNPVVSINSFGVFEEQLSDEVVEQAEKLFIQKAVSELGVDEEKAKDSLENGYIDDGLVTISIVWSDI